MLNLYEEQKQQILKSVVDTKKKIAVLEEEIRTFNLEEYKKKYIADHVEQEYKKWLEDLDKQYHINREQEKTISELIPRYLEKIEKTEKDYSERELEIRKFYQELKKDYEPALYYYGSPQKYLKECERHRKYCDRSYEKTKAELKKEKGEQLRRYFVEIDEAAKQYVKNGISRKSLFSIIELLEKIFKKYEYTVYKPMPISFYQKIEKYKVKLESIPEDLVGKLHDEEKEESSFLINQITDKKIQLEDLRLCLDREGKALTDAQEQLYSSDSNIKKQEIIYENKIKEIETEYQKNDKRISANLEKLRRTISNLECEMTKHQKQIIDFENDINDTDAKLKYTFFIAFSKKKELKNQIEEISHQISKIKIKMEEKEGEIHSAKNQINDLNTKKNDNLSQYRQQLRLLNDEKIKYKENINKLPQIITNITKHINELEKSIKDSEDKLLDLELQLEDFHYTFLAKKFGASVRIPDIVSDKKGVMKKYKSELENLEKEYATIEKQIKEEKKRLQIQEMADKKREDEERQKRLDIIRKQKEKNEEMLRKKEVEKRAKDLFGEELSSDDSNKDIKNENADSGCPVSVVGECLISNNVFKLTLLQNEDISCEEYEVYFADEQGNIISNRRSMKSVSVGNQETTGVTLISNIDFTSMKKCFLKIILTEKENYAIPFKMSISFYSDF